jgi:hypothetical protein
MGWIDLAQDSDNWRPDVFVGMKLQAYEIAGNFLTSLVPVSFSRTLFYGVKLS